MPQLSQCTACHASFGVGAWDRLNGFLVLCPACAVWNGRSWNVRAVALASLFLNCLSFLFTMRPPAAISSAIGFASFVYFTGPHIASHPNLEVAWFITVFFLPILVNAVLLIRHQVKLGQPSGLTPAATSPIIQAPGGIRPQ